MRRQMAMTVVGLGSLVACIAPVAAAGRIPRPEAVSIVLRVADLDRPRARKAGRHRVYAYREWYTPGQHWQPWPSGRHHRYWHGGVTDAFCYGIWSARDGRCYEREWW